MASVDIYQMTTKDTNHKVAPVTIFDAVVNPQNKKTLDQEFEDMVGAVDESVAVDDADATLVTTALRKTEQVLTQAEKKQVRTNINAADADVITELRNIAITSEEDDGDVNFTEPDVVNEAIRKVPQVLSKAEQKQARTNIGAASVEENAEFLDGVEGAIAEIDAKVSDIGSEVTLNGVTYSKECNKYVKELYLRGLDPNKEYSIYTITKGDVSHYLSINEIVEGVSADIRVAGSYTKDLDTSVHEITESDNSGISGYIVIDWGALPEGENGMFAVIRKERVSFLDYNPRIALYLKESDIIHTSEVIKKYETDNNVFLKGEDLYIKELYLEGWTEDIGDIRVTQLFNTDASHYIFTTKAGNYERVATFYEKGLGTNNVGVMETSSDSPLKGYVVVDWDKAKGTQFSGSANTYILNQNKFVSLVSNPIIASFLQSKKSEVIGWILSDSFTIKNASYLNGQLQSPLSVQFPNGVEGSIAINRNNSKDITKIVVSYKNETITYTIDRDSQGNVLSSNII